MKEKMTKKNTFGEFGEQFTQFKDKPVEAIKFLMVYGREKGSGECLKALKVPQIGYVDIVWGENDKNNKGYGLKHIIEKHGKDIEALGFAVEYFIPITLMCGNLRMKEEDGKYIFVSETFRLVISRKYKGKGKQWLLTAFNITRRPSGKTVKR